MRGRGMPRKSSKKPAKPTGKVVGHTPPASDSRRAQKAAQREAYAKQFRTKRKKPRQTE